MKKSFKNVLALSLTCATLFSGTAFAAEETTTNVVNKAPVITKVLDKTEKNALYPNATFTFEIVPGEGTPAGLLTFKDGANSVSFSNADTEGSKELELAFGDLTNVTPGKYSFTIKETAGEVDGISYDSATHAANVTVLVNEGNNDEHYAIVVVDDQTDPASKSDLTFTNTYTTNQLKVTKVVEGNQSVKTDKFEFTITVNGAEGETYATSKEGVVLKTGVPTKVELTNGESFEIYGLSENDTYTVVESNKKGSESGITYTATGEVEKPKVEGAEANAVTVTNTANTEVPTGVIENIAPFVLVIGLAGTSAAIYFKKNKQEA